MKVLIIGAEGNIGRIISRELGKKYEIITAGRNSGEIRADLSSPASITEMFSKLQNIDACICVAGQSYLGDFHSMTQEDLQLSIQDKLIGQVNLVSIGMDYLNDKGSFTLISGRMGDQPSKFSVGKAISNGGINSFTRAAAMEMPRGIRLNTVSPGKISDITIEDLTAAYLQSIEGQINGEIIKVNYN